MSKREKGLPGQANQRPACKRCGALVDIIGECPACRGSRGKVYQEPRRNDPGILGWAREELEEVAEALNTSGTLGSVRLRDLRLKIVRVMSIVKACEGRWRREREHKLSPPKAPKIRNMLIFFGPDNGGEALARDMEEKGILPESRMTERLDELAKDGWHVLHCHFDPVLSMRQWRVLLERFER